MSRKRKVKAMIVIHGTFEHQSKLKGKALEDWIKEKIASAPFGLTGCSSDHGSYDWLPDRNAKDEVIITPKLREDPP